MSVVLNVRTPCHGSGRWTRLTSGSVTLTCSSRTRRQSTLCEPSTSFLPTSCVTKPIDFTIVYPPAVDTPMFEGLLDHEVSAASFAAPSLSPDQLATAIVDAIEDRPREVFAPSRLQGKVARFLWSQPALLRRLIPILEKRGRADLEPRRSERGVRQGKALSRARSQRTPSLAAEVLGPGLSADHEPTAPPPYFVRTIRG
jgi:hypothetical protein